MKKSCSQAWVHLSRCTTQCTCYALQMTQILQDNKPHATKRGPCVDHSKAIATRVLDKALDNIWRLYRTPNIGKDLNVQGSYGTLDIPGDARNRYIWWSQPSHMCCLPVDNTCYVSSQHLLYVMVSKCSNGLRQCLGFESFISCSRRRKDQNSFVLNDLLVSHPKKI